MQQLGGSLPLGHAPQENYIFWNTFFTNKYRERQWAPNGPLLCHHGFPRETGPWEWAPPTSPLGALYWRHPLCMVRLEWVSEALLCRLYSCHPIIHFTWIISTDSVEFLEIREADLEKLVDVQTHFKTTNAIQYLQFSCSHPKRVSWWRVRPFVQF